jgi:hypothetical protein
VIASTLIDGWRVVDGRSVRFQRLPWKPVDLLDFDPATGAQRVLVHLEAERSHGRLQRHAEARFAIANTETAWDCKTIRTSARSAQSATTR